MSDETTLTRPASGAMTPITAVDASLFLNPDSLATLYKAGQFFARSQLVPKHLQGQVEDCALGVAMAMQLGQNPLTVLQNIYVVHGRAGWSAQYMIACANASGVFSDQIAWEYDGKGTRCTSATAQATLAKNGRMVSVTVDMEMAKAEGWTKNPKYRTMPQLMLSYRSATLLIRLYAPEVMLGFRTLQELEDVYPEPQARVVVTQEQIDAAKPATTTPLGSPPPRAIETMPEPTSAPQAAPDPEPEQSERDRLKADLGATLRAMEDAEGFLASEGIDPKRSVSSWRHSDEALMGILQRAKAWQPELEAEPEPEPENTAELSRGAVIESIIYHEAETLLGDREAIDKARHRCGIERGPTPALLKHPVEKLAEYVRHLEGMEG